MNREFDEIALTLLIIFNSLGAWTCLKFGFFLYTTRF